MLISKRGTAGVSAPDISGPSDVGGGKKLYLVNGNRFEVDNRYDVIKAVGYGAYGIVCSACDTASGERVAIKKIPKVFDDVVDGKRILREIKLLAFLHHENVLRLKDIFKPRDMEKFEDLYFVSDLYDTDLHQIIRSKQRLGEEHHAYFLYQAVRAVKYIHSAGVVHRDLKPGNLLVNGNCDLAVCDFGLARGLSTKDMTDYVVTRWYRPPELLLLCTLYSEAVDMWSIGCILAELILRKPLFPGRDYINQLNLITDCIGVPSKDDDLRMIRSEEAVRYLVSMGKKRKGSLKEVVTGASPAALDLMERLLVFNPGNRLTAEEALRHDYFIGLSDQTDEPSCPRTFHWDQDSEPLTEKQLLKGIWDEIHRYHPT
jgi:mitogen-activated protein kinase 1/3